MVEVNNIWLFVHVFSQLPLVAEFKCKVLPYWNSIVHKNTCCHLDDVDTRHGSITVYLYRYLETQKRAWRGNFVLFSFLFYTAEFVTCIRKYELLQKNQYQPIIVSSKSHEFWLSGDSCLRLTTPIHRKECLKKSPCEAVWQTPDMNFQELKVRYRDNFGSSNLACFLVTSLQF